jgi:hypothetical protein
MISQMTYEERTNYYNKQKEYRIKSQLKKKILKEEQTNNLNDDLLGKLPTMLNKVPKEIKKINNNKQKVKKEDDKYYPTLTIIDFNDY